MPITAPQFGKPSAGQRGKKSEKKVEEYLKAISDKYAHFDFERLPDARAAGGRLKSQIADFSFFMPGQHGVIEVKETEHEYRLPVDKVPQLSRMHRRALAGGLCLVLIYHSTLKVWRRPGMDWLLAHRGGASFDMSRLPHYLDLDEALRPLNDLVSAR